jgi:hypothetical protein
MSNKYTFWELCNSYNKIEVPIIQRDYAQGRNTADVEKLRNKFVNDYLIKSIVANEKIELDFVYGSILTEVKEDEKQKIFIPLDGQQRLTTLFLLHFFVAIKENRLPEIKDTLIRFTYETRPSAHDFCKLLLGVETIDNLSKIKTEIEDSVWFNEEWKHDPTVSGMLNMLDTFAKNEVLLNAPTGLLDQLIGNKSDLVTFYFTDLDQFGLTENLYIRMNARGKMLTEFENFKSEFSKIIRYNHSLLEIVKDKIEYEWVDNLWDYRASDSFIIDSPFMAYLSFLTEMLYFKDAKFRAESYDSDFLDFRVLKEVYSMEENLKFLIFSFDFIREVKDFKEAILWEGETLHSILKNILSNKRDTNELFIYFLTLLYSYNKKPKENLKDYIRVVRNLIENTDDNSRREWPRLISSLQNLISDKNVYTVLSELKDENKLQGFNVDQRKEEVFKAKLIQEFSGFKGLLFEIEDSKNFKGNITNILKIPFVDSEEKFKDYELESIVYEEKQLKVLGVTYEGYKEISNNNFNFIWGNLLITSLYTQTYESRLVYSGLFKKHPAILLFAKRFAKSKLALPDYTKKIQKDFILSLAKKFDDFSEIKQVKDQLYLYYIISERIYSQTYIQFFKNHNFNFGWLSKETGYKSLFTHGIEGCQYFHSANPIFQIYNQQFRYNLGLNENNTLDIEIVGGNKKRNPFDLIIKWANEN